MSSQIISGAALILVLTAGTALAQSPQLHSRAADGRAPTATGSIRGGIDGSFATAERAPSLFGPQRPVSSTFNPSTARARHYER